MFLGNLIFPAPSISKSTIPVPSLEALSLSRSSLPLSSSSLPLSLMGSWQRPSSSFGAEASSPPTSGTLQRRLRIGARTAVAAWSGGGAAAWSTIGSGRRAAPAVGVRWGGRRPYSPGAGTGEERRPRSPGTSTGEERRWIWGPAPASGPAPPFPSLVGGARGHSGRPARRPWTSRGRRRAPLLLRFTSHLAEAGPPPR